MDEIKNALPKIVKNLVDMMTQDGFGTVEATKLDLENIDLTVASVHVTKDGFPFKVSLTVAFDETDLDDPDHDWNEE